MPSPELSSPAVDNGASTSDAVRNGHAAPESSSVVPPSGEAPAATAAPEAPASPTERAEEMVDWVAVTAAHLISSVGRGLLTAAAHAREATEDFWAEVQSVRRERR